MRAMTRVALLAAAWVAAARPDAASLVELQPIAVPTAEARNLVVQPGADGQVIIFYDLIASDPKASVTVTLEGAAPNSNTFDVTPRATRGDVGSGVHPGPDKRIVWEAAKDIEDVDAHRFRFRILTTPVPVSGAAIGPTVPGRGTITVISSPDGAQITLDGRPLGLAPLEIRNVSAGQHRLIVRKAGYADGGRIIEVKAGESTRIEIPLGAPGAASAVEPAKGGSMKWIAIGGGGAAAAAAAALAGGRGSSRTTPGATTTTPSTPTTTTPTPTPNRPPTITCGNVIFGGLRTLQTGDVGAVSATRFQFFIAAAADVDGDALSFTMTFGNGITQTGPYSATNNSVTYVYPGAGNFSPSVTVRDARGGESGCRFPSIITSTVVGEWIGPASTGVVSSRLVLNQSGVNVSGSYFEDQRPQASTLQGTLATNAAGRKDGHMTLNVGGSFANQLTFSLEPSDDLRTYRGTYTYRGRTATFEMTRR